MQRLVGTDELRAALASSILPPSTLVWREGMKEWAPASSMPELASAAFAAGADSFVGKVDRPLNPPSAEPKLPSFDLRSTAERRATLVGLPPPAETAPVDDGGKAAKPSGPPVAVPGPRPDGPPVSQTQAPPFGTPSPAKIPVAKPKRTITTTGLDANWATTTRSDEDDTIPRRARPSELAAAAAAAAEANSSLREVRARPMPKAVPAPRPPVHDGVPAAKPSAPEGVPAPKPPLPLRKAPPALPASSSAPLPRRAPPRRPAGGRPGGERRAGRRRGSPQASQRRLQPAAPAAPAPHAGQAGGPRPPTPAASDPRRGRRAHRALGAGEAASRDAGRPSATGGRRRPPAAPPAPVESTEPHLPAPGARPRTVTLTGTSSPVFSPEAAPQVPPEQAAASAVIPSTQPAPVVAEPLPSFDYTEPAPSLPALAAAPVEARSTTSRTLVSARDAIESIPGLAEAVAVSIEDTEVLAGSAVDDVAARAAAAAAFEDAVTTAKAPPHQNGAAHAGGYQSAPEPVVEAARPPSPPSSRPPPPLPHAARPPLPSFPLPPRAPAQLHPPAVEPDAPLEPEPDEPEAAPRPDASRFATTTIRSPPRATPGEADEHAPRRPLNEAVSVPLSSLLGAGGLLIGMVVTAFFVGRASSSGAPRLTAHASLASVPALARAALPPPPKPCWMVKQPTMWAPQASRTIPFDAVATRTGSLAVGYARDARQAMGIEVDLSTGEVRARLDDKAKEEIERVVPTPGVEFHVARTGTGGLLAGPIEMPASKPFAVGVAAGAIALAAPPEGAPVTLWGLPGEEGLGAAGIRADGERGYTLVYRRGGAIWGGFIGADHKAGELVKVEGSGGAVGKPASAWNGREVAVIFADRPDPAGHYQIRVGHAPPGKTPTTTELIPLPHGGPGGDAFAPEIAGLPDGRWLLMWTEGGAGARAVRAQTLAADFHPLGDPIALSPPAGNYGQGVIGVVGAYAATVFLSKGSSSYELWGAVLQCGG